MQSLYWVKGEVQAPLLLNQIILIHRSKINRICAENQILSKILTSQLQNCVSCGRVHPSHMVQHCASVDTKLLRAELFLVDPWSMDQADPVWSKQGQKYRPLQPLERYPLQYPGLKHPPRVWILAGSSPPGDLDNCDYVPLDLQTRTSLVSGASRGLNNDCKSIWRLYYNGEYQPGGHYWKYYTGNQ